MADDPVDTFMLVRGRPDEIRTVAVTRTALMGLAGFAAVVLAFLSLSAFSLFHSRPAVAAAGRPAAAAEESPALAAELEALESRLETLDGQMSVLLRRNEELRILADLPRIPVEVTAVGVGGPRREPLIAAAGVTAGGAALAAGAFERRLGEAESALDVLLRRSSLVSQSMREAEQIIRSKTQRWSATPSIWPADGFLSSPFTYARKHPLLGSFRPHYGVDISARAGSRVVATAAGRVTFAGWRSGSGNHVEIDHGYGVRTTYSHNAKLLVKKGDGVERGSPIGLVGSTGFSLGPHVHYEVHKNGQPVDPTKFVFPDVVAD